MTKDFSYSQSIEIGGGAVTFSVSGCHSFDEAIAVIERAVYEHGLKEAAKQAAEEKKDQHQGKGKKE